MLAFRKHSFRMGIRLPQSTHLYIYFDALNRADFAHHCLRYLTHHRRCCGELLLYFVAFKCLQPPTGLMSVFLCVLLCVAY